MATPLASDLAGLEWGYQGRPYATLAGPGITATDPTEWAFQSRGFYLVDDAADPTAPRRITSARALVLAGNPSLAEGRITAYRAMVLRSSAQEDSERRVTTLRVHTLRTNDIDDAPRQVTAIRGLVLRTNRRGDVARPGVSTFLTFNDENLGGGTGEFHVDGFVGIATKDPTATNRADVPTPIFPDDSAIKLPAGYSAGALTASLLEQINRALPPAGSFIQSNVFNSFGTIISNLDVVGGPTVRFPMGLVAVGSPGYIPHAGFFNEVGWVGNLSYPQPVSGQALSIPAGGIGKWYDPPPGGYPGTCYGFTVARPITNTQSINGGPPSVRTERTSTTISFSDTLGLGPRVSLAIRPGLGPVRVVKWIEGFTTASTGIPPFPGVSADFSFLEGQTFASMDALVEFLLSQAAFVPNSPVDTLGQNLRFTLGSFSNTPGLVYKPWVTLLGATANTPKVAGSLVSRDIFATGSYPTGVGSAVRFRRLKTIRLHPGIVIPGPVVGNSIPYGDGNETYSASAVSNTFRWSPPGGNVTATFQLPCLYVEKLDSPSTHFNDPPGSYGVDD